MARFLFTVWPFAGHVHPSIAIALALKARGHAIAFYSGATVRSTIEAEGFRFFPFSNVDEEKVSAIVSSEFSISKSFWQKVRRAKRLQAKFREWLLDTVPQQLRDLDEVMKAWHPDVLVCDSALWGPILVLAETQQVPIAVLSVLAACILPGPDAPAWGRGLPQPRNGAMRLWNTLERKLVAWLSGGFRVHVNALRERYGLSALRDSVTEFAGRMPLYLVPSAREYDYARNDLPRSVHYVGPCLWDKPDGSPSPQWLTQLSGHLPLIYVTEATIGTTEPFLLKAAAHAFADGPFLVVMTTGTQRKWDGLGLEFPIAANIRIEPYIPQSDLLPRTAVMVTLGGSGGVLAALRVGVPLVVVPTEWDRPENAQRVVAAGAGLRIAPDRCTPARLRAAVERVLAEPTFRQNAQRLSRALAHYDGPGRAAQLLEELSCHTANEEGLREGVGRVH